jgi:hypothetical protein
VRVAWEVTPLSVPPTGIGRYILGSLEAMAANVCSAPDDAGRASDYVARGCLHVACFTWAATGEEISQAIEEMVA